MRIFFLLFFRCGGIWRPQPSGVANSCLEWQWRLKFKKCRFTRRCNSLLFFFLDHDDCVLWKLCLPCIFLLFMVTSLCRGQREDFWFWISHFRQRGLCSRFFDQKLFIRSVCVVFVLLPPLCTFHLLFWCMFVFVLCFTVCAVCAHTQPHALPLPSLPPLIISQCRYHGRTDGWLAETLPRSTAVCGRGGRLFLQLLSLAVPRRC